MNTQLLIAASLLPVGLAATGCAANESPRFRAMTALEHESLAQMGSDPAGATAAEHLEAARQLRETERALCAEVPEAEKERGPFLRADRIVAVERVQDRRYPKWPLQLYGASLVVRATPGVTEQWLDRVIQCHVAHFAVVGVAASPAPSPFLVNGAVVRVSSTSDGFRVSITSRDIETAREILSTTGAMMHHVS